MLANSSVPSSDVHRLRFQIPFDESAPGRAVGQRHFDGVVAGGAGAQGGVQVGQVLHQEKGEVAGGVQGRVGAPAEQRDEQVPVVGRHHG